MWPAVVATVFMLCLLATCAPDGHPKGWQPLDLMGQGVPLTVLAPPDTEIKPGGWESTLLQDLTLDGGEEYNVQLFYTTATSNDIAKLKNDLLQSVKRSRYFQRVVKEDVAGFIYENRIDTIPSFGFRLVKLQGDLEVNFHSGYNQIFTLEEVESMYEAVK
jgi:hypothetical protein